MLENLYYNHVNPSAFTGLHNLKRAAHSKGISPNETKNWLRSQPSYTTHNSARKRFPRNKYLSDHPHQYWQADLNDVKILSKYNDNNRYILTVIDVFSKKAYARAIKNKTPAEIIPAFREIFLQAGNVPENLQTDKGGEFTSKIVKKFLKENNVNYFTTRNPDIKASIIERFNRTIKNRLFRYMDHHQTYRYIDILEDIVVGYNNTRHRTIKMTPNDVNDDNLLQVYRNTYNTKNKVIKKPKLKVGQHVRIARYKGIFEKGYETNFSEEVFRIKRVIQHPRPVYEIEDLMGEVIEGYFYEPELQLVNYSEGAESFFKIDKIIKTVGKSPSKRLYVSWRGYPAKFNSWVNENDIVNL